MAEMSSSLFEYSRSRARPFNEVAQRLLVACVAFVALAYVLEYAFAAMGLQVDRAYSGKLLGVVKYAAAALMGYLFGQNGLKD